MITPADPRWTEVAQRLAELAAAHPHLLWVIVGTHVPVAQFPLRVELRPLATPAGADPASPALDCLLSALSPRAASVVRSASGACADLLRELDGLPLALMLAAPRLELLGLRRYCTGFGAVVP